MGRIAAITCFIGLGLWVWGTLFRMMHWPFATMILLSAYIVLPAGAFSFIIAVIRNKGLTGVMDPPQENEEGG